MPANVRKLIVDQSLINKYTLRGPRYTSYPTAPEWHTGVTEETFWKHLDETNRAGNDAPLSVYIHIPFCAQRCYYCACNVIITPHHDVSDEYVETVSGEIDMVAPNISPARRVVQFHLGGGTPTHLKPESLDRLLSHVERRFIFDDNAERSIEVDPRVTKPEHIDVLRKHRFNRISFGVEDFYNATQIAINRMQDIDGTKELVNLCRASGFVSVNIDLVYGLPHQTLTTFAHTVDIINEIDPDRIALYNYAHLPDKVPHQRKIEAEWLPGAEERFEIFKLAVERFEGQGLEYIGMDHFAKPQDELTLARQDGTLQRNFMGFTTKAGTDLYAFGTSSISSLSALYTQNGKNLRQYRAAVEERHLPIERGIELSEDDRMRRWVIMELMCNLRVSFDGFRRKWGRDFREYFHNEIDQLQPFIDDGLVNPDLSERIAVTDIGQIIVRPVAMLFDAYLAKMRAQTGGKRTFSNTL